MVAQGKKRLKRAANLALAIARASNQIETIGGRSPLSLRRRGFA
jgi:hypothetical protein